MTTVTTHAPRLASGWPDGRLVRAEVMKLRKRRGLVAWTLMVILGAVVVQYGVFAGLHVVSPVSTAPAGGVRGFVISTWVLTAIGGVLAVVIGAIVGTADVETGVFRDLVATGRSRLALFAARVPGGLAFLMPIVAVAYALATVACILFAGPAPHPSAALVAQGMTWVLLPTAVWFSVTLGIASLVGSRGVAIGVMLGWKFVAEPVLAAFGPFIGPWRHAALQAALVRILPPVFTVGPFNMNATTDLSASVAASVIMLWIAAALAAGAWRTHIRDA
jgi:hypothetical protein